MQSGQKLIVLSSNTAHSVWNFRRSLIRRLLETGYAVTVVAPPDETVARIESLGCAFVPFIMDNKGTDPVRDAALFVAYHRLYRRLRPHAALHFTIKPNVYGGLACRLLGIPYVSMITGLGTAFIRDSWLTRVVEGLYRMSQRRAHAVLFQNPDDSALFRSRRLVPEAAIHQVPGSGIDLQHFCEMPAPDVGNAPVFLLIARLLRDKGIVEFVDAARMVKARCPGARFQLLGAVGVENRTAIQRAEVDAWVAEGVVEYLGVTDDVRPFITAASCVVLPSYREGTPRSLLEAAATARPVIATDVPGCREVLNDGESGFLCEVKNPNSLADAMSRFVALNADGRLRMGRAGRAKMEHEFCESIVLDRYSKLLVSIPVKP